GSWRNILACMLRRRRIPDLTGEAAVPHRIKSLGGTHTDRKSPPDEWIVLGRPVRRPFLGILFRMLNILISHKEYHPVHRSRTVVLETTITLAGRAPAQLILGAGNFRSLRQASHWF